MDREQGNSSSMSVALNCPGQSHGWAGCCCSGGTSYYGPCFPSAAGWERILCGSGLQAPLQASFQKEVLAVCLGALVPSQCFRALQLHLCFAQPHVVPKDKGQDVADWDHLMGDLSPGWCPKERQCKSTGPFLFLGVRVLSAKTPCTSRGGCPTQSLLGSPSEQWLMFGGTSCGHGPIGLQWQCQVTRRCWQPWTSRAGTAGSRWSVCTGEPRLSAALIGSYFL